MMRITNSMMTSNTKSNINLNKLNEDKLNTQVATGQKIARPSDDPVIAIRALRFNTSLSQLNQYYEKNIPDADAWLKVTETALSQTNSLFDSIKENLTGGASDTNTPSDRQKILESLKALRTEVYSSGNADYAGRTVFTGYRTGESLTFLTTDQDLTDNYMIHQNLSYDDVKEMTYITSADVDNGKTEMDVESVELYRIRLPYETLNQKDGDELTITVYDEDPDTGIKTENAGDSITVTTKSIKGLNQAQIDDIYTNVGDGEAVLIPETGEIIIGKTAAETLKNLKDNQSAAIEYNKDKWQSGDLRPEHYFACEKTDSALGKKVQYNYSEEVNKETEEKTGNMIPDFHNQELQVEISYNQKITINTNASEVYTPGIVRDIDDLVKITQDVVDLESKITELESDLKKADSETEKNEIQTKLDAVNKEYSLKKDQMQKMFSKALDIFDGYADKNNLVISAIGSLSNRLSITKDRVADQLQSFKELADGNINVSLTDAAIDLSNAELALQAAQLSASKIAQQTLLNYL